MSFDTFDPDEPDPLSDCRPAFVRFWEWCRANPTPALTLALFATAAALLGSALFFR